MIEVIVMTDRNTKEVEMTTEGGNPRRDVIDKMRGEETDRLKEIGLTTKETEMNRRA